MLYFVGINIVSLVSAICLGRETVVMPCSDLFLHIQNWPIHMQSHNLKVFSKGLLAIVYEVQEIFLSSFTCLYQPSFVMSDSSWVTSRGWDTRESLCSDPAQTKTWPMAMHPHSLNIPSSQKTNDVQKRQQTLLMFKLRSLSVYISHC